MSDPTFLPIADFLPDLPSYPAPGSANIRNVYPRTKVSYGAVGSPMAQFSALNKRCQGAAGYRDSGGNVFLFAGDANDLYALNVSVSDWANVSSAPGAYNTTEEQMWEFVYFNGDVIATNFADPMQYYNINTPPAGFADLPGTPPKARHLAVVKNSFVVAGNTFDAVNGNMPQRVWWCDAGNAHSWSTPGTTAAAAAQAGAVDLLGDGGWVMGFAPSLANADAVVFQQYAVRRMVYAGPPVVFDFLPAENARGTDASRSIVVQGGIAYYFGQDGFYAFDGSASQPIGVDKVDKTVLNDIDLGNLGRMVGAASPFNNLILWAYPSKGNNGVCNRILVYNWVLQKFDLLDVPCETLVRLLGLGYNLDELYTLLGYSIDNVPASLDSPIWTGGRLSLGLFGTDHRMAFFSGDPLQATVETSEMAPYPGRRMFVRNTRPLIDGVNSSCTVAIGHRERQQDAVTFAQPTTLNSMGLCPARASGRYITTRVVIPSSNTWTNISGVEVEGDPMGTR
jgi:hypothetical protein